MKLKNLLFFASLLSSSQAFSAVTPALVHANEDLVKQLTGTFKVESCEGTYTNIWLQGGDTQPLVPGSTSIFTARSDGLQVTRIWTAQELAQFTHLGPQLDSVVEDDKQGNNFRAISTFDNDNQTYTVYSYFTYSPMSSPEELVNSVEPHILSIKATEKGLIVNDGPTDWTSTECILSRQ